MPVIGKNPSFTENQFKYGRGIDIFDASNSLKNDSLNNHLVGMVCI